MTITDRLYEIDARVTQLVILPRDVNSGVLIKKVGLGVRLTIKRESQAGRRSPRCTAKRSA